jgi:cytochrome P450
MLTVDEPDHRRLRLLVSKAFTPRYIKSLRPRVQEMADELLERVQDQG